MNGVIMTDSNETFNNDDDSEFDADKLGIKFGDLFSAQTSKPTAKKSSSKKESLNNKSLKKAKSIKDSLMKSLTDDIEAVTYHQQADELLKEYILTSDNEAKSNLYEGNKKPVNSHMDFNDDADDTDDGDEDDYTYKTLPVQSFHINKNELVATSKPIEIGISYPKQTEQSSTGVAVLTVSPPKSVETKKPENTDFTVKLAASDDIDDTGFAEAINQIKDKIRKDVRQLEKTESIAVMTHPPIIKTHLPYLIVSDGKDKSTIEAIDISLLDSNKQFMVLWNALEARQVKAHGLFSPISDFHDKTLELVTIDKNLYKQLMSFDVADLNRHALKFDVAYISFIRRKEYENLSQNRYVKTDEVFDEASIRELRNRTLEPLTGSLQDKVVDVIKIRNSVFTCRADTQSQGFFSLPKDEAVKIDDVQDKIYASYAKSLQDSGQGVVDYRSIDKEFWHLKFYDGDVVDQLVEVYQQYQHLSKVLVIYHDQVKAETKTSFDKFDYYLEALDKILINILSSIVFVRDVVNLTKNGVRPIIALHDRRAVIDDIFDNNIIKSILQDNEYAIIHGYTHLFLEINKLLPTEKIIKLPRLKRLQSFLQGMLSIDLEQMDFKLPFLPLSAVDSLLNILAKQPDLNTKVINSEGDSIDNSNVIITYLGQSTPIHGQSAFYLMYVNPSDNNHQSWIESFKEKTVSAACFKIENSTTFETTLDDQHKALLTTRDNLPFLENGVFVDEVVVNDSKYKLAYHYVDYQPLGISTIIDFIADLQRKAYDKIVAEIDELPIRLIDRLEDLSFNSNAKLFKELPMAQKYVFAYHFLNPNLPYQYLKQLHQFSQGYVCLPVLRCSVKKEACPNFLAENTPATSKLLPINNSINKAFFYDRDEWVITLGYEQIGNDTIQYDFRLGDQKIYRADSIFDIWNVNEGEIYQTHFTLRDALLFDIQKNEFANTPSKYLLENAFNQYKGSEGVDRVLLSTRQEKLLKPLKIKDYTGRIFEFFSYKYT